METAPLVLTEGRRRTLEFRPGNVQSEMDLHRPYDLVLAYTRAMMAFALFVPRPRDILMIGLGGGSLAKFCYRHFPDARITVVELRADVIAVRDQFMVPADDARFRVVHADAVDYIDRHPGSADVVLVDAFNEIGLPAAVATARFYSGCRKALRDGGVMVKNVFSYDPAYAPILSRLGLIFDGRLCWLKGVAGNNRILFAVRAAPGAAGDATRAARLQRFLSRRDGIGANWLNRLLVASLLIKLRRRRR
jgi:spermidine synthase